MSLFSRRQRLPALADNFLPLCVAQRLRQQWPCYSAEFEIRGLGVGGLAPWFGRRRKDRRAYDDGPDGPMVAGGTPPATNGVEGAAASCDAACSECALDGGPGGSEAPDTLMADTLMAGLTGLGLARVEEWLGLARGGSSGGRIARVACLGAPVRTSLARRCYCCHPRRVGRKVGKRGCSAAAREVAVKEAAGSDSSRRHTARIPVQRREGTDVLPNGRAAVPGVEPQVAEPQAPVDLCAEDSEVGGRRAQVDRGR
eukprot:scaffold14572_cov62-Phaeocystis_antarctica.AAC.1